MALISIPQHFSIPFTRHRWLPLILLISMTALVVLGFFVRGFNWGVDFRGGLSIEAQLLKPRDLNELRREMKTHLSHDISIQELGKSQNTLLIRTEKVDQLTPLLEKMKHILGEGTSYRHIESIGPKVGSELVRNGLYAILWSLVSMMAFVWFRFEWQFSLCAFIALLHDCLGILAFFMWSGLEFNEGAIVAILITAAYSINDTVVIFDRLRDNIHRQRYTSLAPLINASLNETLSRTLLTSSTTLLALVMLYLFGGEVISTFSLPILVGILIGTYSSLIIAVPLLQWLPFQTSRVTSIKEERKA